MRLHEQRTVDRPQGEVFEYTADFSHIDQWDPGVASSRKHGDQPVGLGSRFDVEARFGANTIPMVYEITVFEPNERVVLVGKGDTLDAVDEIRFQAVGGRTLIDYTADLTFHNWIRYVAPIMSPMLKRVGARALDGLVSALSG